MRRQDMIKKLEVFTILAIGAALLMGNAPAQKDSTRVQSFWERASKEEYKSPGELQAQHERELRKGEYYVKLMRGDPKDKVVALTFDDGPHPQFTPKILAILRKYNVNATFFVVGKMAKKYPQLIKEEYAEGNIVGNHTYDHVNLTKIPDDEVGDEWQKGNDVVKSILGVSPAFCRPPGGDYDHDVIAAAMKSGLTTVLWTDDPGDYARPGDKIIERRVLDRIENGAIILIHDGVQQTIDVLPQIIGNLQKRGFKFVTVRQMMADNSVRTFPAHSTNTHIHQPKASIPALKCRAR